MVDLAVNTLLMEVMAIRMMTIVISIIIQMIPIILIINRSHLESYGRNSLCYKKVGLSLLDGHPI